MKNKKIFLMLLLILTFVIFTVACSTYNATPDVPNATDEDTNRNGIVDYNNENGNANNSNGNSTNGTSNGGLTTNSGINNNTNQ